MDQTFTAEQTASILSISARTLEAGRQGRGTFRDLPYVKLGSRVAYSAKAIQDRIESGTVTPKTA